MSRRKVIHYTYLVNKYQCGYISMIFLYIMSHLNKSKFNIRCLDRLIYIYIYICVCVCVCVCVCWHLNYIWICNAKSCLNFTFQGIFYKPRYKSFVVWIFETNLDDICHLRLLNYCLHLYFYSHNVSADMSSGLIQVFVELGRLHRTSN